MRTKIFIVTMLLLIPCMIYPNNLNIPDNEVERITKAGELAGKAMFYNLDWKSFYLKFMEIERKKNWNEKQIAFIGLYFGAVQGKYCEEMKTSNSDNIEIVKYDLNKYMSELYGIKFSDKPAFFTDILWYDLCENKNYNGAVIYPVGEFDRSILIIQFTDNKVSYGGVDRYSENIKINDRKFNKRIWQKNKSRINMVRDIFKLIEGGTKDEVRRILGEEDGTYFREYGYEIIKNDNEQISELLDKWINVWKIKNNEEAVLNYDNNNQNFDFIYIISGKELTGNFSVSSFFDFIKNDTNIKYIYNEFFHSNLYMRKFEINNNAAQVVCDLVFSKPQTISDTFLIKFSAGFVFNDKKWAIKTVKFSSYENRKLYKLGNVDLNKVFYKSTLAIPLFTNNKESAILNEYALFKIINNDNLLKFYDYLDSIVGNNKNSNYEKNMIIGIFSRGIRKGKIMYLIISPKSSDIFIEQPYFIDNKNILIHEIKRTGPADGRIENKNKDDYYLIRFISVDKDEDFQFIIKELDREILLSNSNF